MKSQEARDEQAVVIGTALAVFVGTLVAFAALAGSVRLLTGQWPSIDGPWSPLVVSVGALLAVGYLVRQRS